MTRETRRAIAQETVEIIERGGYGDVRLTEAVERAVAGTRLHLPDDPLPAPDGGGDPEIQVTNETSLAAARRGGVPMACLNFASARSPGGGFLNGAEAQEESLARASALYPCLRAADAYYEYHRAHRDPMYTDRVIYSPAVPVFRDDEGNLLPEPYPVSFLTAAAPNRTALDPDRWPEVPAVLARRADRVLAVAAAHGHRHLVLGAWGCGVFGNDPAVVAQVFAAALRRGPRFDQVVFAVLDRAPGTPTYTAFADVFPRA
ncbi:TIGR02452 family protein [Cryptosporangium phraense]|uniref:TIGR02452 family protein n=1 Tax=Cryptosporangium phraense TaxID=2593070 RepID=UPI001F108805|nr:TIGR02452 family protein [Cryptosporangium phraense]